MLLSCPHFYSSSPLGDVETMGSQGQSERGSGGGGGGAVVSGGGGGMLGVPGMRGAVGGGDGGGRHARLETPLERSLRRSQRMLFWSVSAAGVLLAILVSVGRMLSHEPS